MYATGWAGIGVALAIVAALLIAFLGPWAPIYAVALVIFAAVIGVIGLLARRLATTTPGNTSDVSADRTSGGLTRTTHQRGPREASGGGEGASA